MLDFLILYENKEREIKSVSLLKCSLEELGYCVQLEQIQYFHKRKIKTRVVIVPFLYSDLDIYKYIYVICGKCQKVINLRWEQVFSRYMENEKQGFFYPKGQCKKVYHICWGKKQCLDLIERGVKPECAVRTGAIQIDFFSDLNGYKSKEQIAEEYGLDPNKKWILFVSSFSNASLSEQEEKKLINMLGEERRKFIEVSKISRKKILEWFKNFLDKENKYEIIYRPHPSELTDYTLNNYVKERIHIIKNEVVAQWIIVCDKVFNWISTSAIEIYLLGKGGNLLRPSPIPYEQDMNIFEDCNKIITFEDFCIQAKSENQLVNNSSFEAYYDVNNYQSYKRVLNLCVSVIARKRGCDIDYKEIVRKISLWKRIKYELLYKIYIPILFLAGRIVEFTNRKPKFLNGYFRVKSNTLK